MGYNTTSKAARNRENDSAGQPGAEEIAAVHRTRCRILGLDPEKVTPSQLAEMTADDLAKEALEAKNALIDSEATHRRDAPVNPRWSNSKGYQGRRH